MAVMKMYPMGLFGRSKPKDDTIEQMRVLLDNFQFADLETFCAQTLGVKPAIDQEHLSSIEVLDFIWDQYHKGKIQFLQLKEFAIKNHVVAESFFE
ncbi:protein of unknown function [Nitrosotalea devaniterrae]|uniref:Uncharacterized protein n=1 Tax=Nitrosotalea devaniterrae TaxID=1078905 RepID=A0A128A4U6_9ARCH|nr:protein of unknown function [Candidatus Nitrosotalea devanaterra]